MRHFGTVCLKPRSDLIDLTGKRFGRLTVLRYAKPKKWVVQCDCGSPPKEVDGKTIRDGVVVSCGCFHRQQLLAAITKHGACNTPEYSSWKHMLTRCYNPRNRTYANYGGRGIRACSRWRGKHGFENFLADMGYKPTPQHSIERKNNNKGYNPRNCSWVTRHEQAINTRRTVILEVNGVRKPISEWAHAAGLAKTDTITRRLRRGWSPADAVGPPRNMGSRTHRKWQEKHKAEDK